MAVIEKKDKEGNWVKFNIKEYCKPYERLWAEFDWEKCRENIEKGIPCGVNTPSVSAYIPNPKWHGPIVMIQLYNREELFKDTDELIIMLSDGTKLRETIDFLEVIE